MTASFSPSRYTILWRHSTFQSFWIFVFFPDHSASNSQHSHSNFVWCVLSLHTVPFFTIIGHWVQSAQRCAIWSHLYYEFITPHFNRHWYCMKEQVIDWIPRHQKVSASVSWTFIPLEKDWGTKSLAVLPPFIWTSWSYLTTTTTTTTTTGKKDASNSLKLSRTNIWCFVKMFLRVKN